MATKLIIGLGNVGDNYRFTRHNAGFMALDHYLNDTHWSNKPKFKAQVAEINNGENKVIFAKPQTMMNLSGEAVSALMQFYKLEPKAVLAVYDDFEVNFGSIRTRHGGGTAGHNGVESLIKHIGEDFYRLRIGVGSERKQQAGASDFVLSAFNKEESEQLEKMFTETDKLIDRFIADTLDQATIKV